MFPHREEGIHHNGAGIDVNRLGVARLEENLGSHVQKGPALGRNRGLVTDLDAESEVGDLEGRQIVGIRDQNIF